MIHTRRRNFSSLLLAGLMIVSAIVPFVRTQDTSALSGSDFNAGRIIDDAVFYNSQSMSPAQIQQFLNAKVPSCDTNGTGIAREWGSNLTRAQYANYMYTNKVGKNWQYWHQPPYTCLKDYVQSTPQMEAASGLCGAIPATSGRTSSDIISTIAQACNINPQVLIVLLEKEQSLVTDIWPLQNQYSKATGFDCPDTAPCDPAYSGFFYQVYYAARQFKMYQKYPTNYNYIAGRTNRVYYNPNLSACGSSQVYIENQATAALYIYTPYQPNAAALNNISGTGDSCSSYGNRNFWKLFNTWFGSSIVTQCGTSEPILPTVNTYYNPTTFKHFYTSYSCEGYSLTSKLGYRSEGAEFNTTDPANPNAEPIYRLYNSRTEQHLWTNSQDEITSAQQGAGYKLEGVGFYTAKNIGTTNPVYRLYNPRTFQHIWTQNQNVINYLVANSDFKLEGIAFYSQ